jgi:hypothetical protein
VELVLENLENSQKETTKKTIKAEAYCILKEASELIASFFLMEKH